MHRAIGILLFIATVVFMEGFVHVARCWLMHGPGWFLHASHHAPRHGDREWNDLYAAIVAVSSIVLLLGGGQWSWWPGTVWIGAGIATYGAIYFGFHDVIVHRRLHHAVGTKHGTVSLGFLWAPRPEHPKAELKARGNAGVRAPAAATRDPVDRP